MRPFNHVVLCRSGRPARQREEDEEADEATEKMRLRTRLIDLRQAQFEQRTTIRMIGQARFAMPGLLVVGGGNGIAQVHAQSGGRLLFLGADAGAIVAHREDHAAFRMLAAAQCDLRACKAAGILQRRFQRQRHQVFIEEADHRHVGFVHLQGDVVAAGDAVLAHQGIEEVQRRDRLDLRAQALGIGLVEGQEAISFSCRARQVTWACCTRGTSSDRRRNSPSSTPREFLMS